MVIKMDNSESVCCILRKTYNSDVNSVKQAERELNQISQTPTYLYDLMHIIFEKPVEIEVKISATVAFKNFINSNWSENISANLNDATKNAVKSSVLNYILKSPIPIQKQLIDIILNIAKCDFPDRWDNLIPQIVAILNNGSLEHYKIILKLCACLFDRYRYEFQTNDLLLEIKHVLDVFALPFTNLFKKLMDEMSNSQNHLNILQLLKYSIRIYHCLIAQEFPEFFEDHQNEWFSWFIALLQLNINAEDARGGKHVQLDKVKTRIIQVISLFKRKYSSDLKSYDTIFIETIWKLSVEGIRENSHEQLGSECIKFMLIAFSMTPVENLLAQRDSVIGLCSHVIVPSIIVQTTDEERFEDEPHEYVRLEIEGDMDSRRQSAVEFIGVLSNIYEDILVPIFLEFVKHLILKQNEESANAWKYQDASIRMIMAISSNFGTSKFGTVRTSSFIDLNKIFEEIVAPHLFNPNTRPILLVTCIKYLINFRQSLNIEIVNKSIVYLINLLKHPSITIQITICILIDHAFLSPSDPNSSKRLSLLVDNLQNLYSSLIVLAKPSCTHVCDKSIKSITGILSHTQIHSKAYLPSLAGSFLMILCNLNTVSVTPDYLFNFYNGYCLCLRLIHNFSPETLPSIVSHLIEPLSNLIESDVHNSFEYLVQLFSVIIYDFCSFDIPQINSFYSQLLTDQFWNGEFDRVYVLTFLLNSFCHSASHIIISRNDYHLFFALFTKLCINTKFDAAVFNILNSLILHLRWNEEHRFPPSIFDSIFDRLTKLKRPKFVLGFCEFIYYFINKFSPLYFYQCVEAIQPNIINRIIDNILFAELKTCTHNKRKKILFLTIAQLLLSITELMSKDPLKWANNIAKLLTSNPPQHSSINPQDISFYASLGNSNLDLIPISNESYSEPIVNILPFARHTVEFHSNIFNPKEYVQQMILKIRLNIPRNAWDVLEPYIPI